MITASHNPKEYNGFKVYNARGGQITPDEAAKIEKYLPAVFPGPDLPTEAEAIAKGLFFRGGKAEEAVHHLGIGQQDEQSEKVSFDAGPHC